MLQQAAVDAHIHLTDRFGRGGLENEWVAGTEGLQKDFPEIALAAVRKQEGCGDMTAATSDGHRVPSRSKKSKIHDIFRYHLTQIIQTLQFL